jgi:hypothetical protein
VGWVFQAANDVVAIEDGTCIPGSGAMTVLEAYAGHKANLTFSALKAWWRPGELKIQMRIYKQTPRLLQESRSVILTI